MLSVYNVTFLFLCCLVSVRGDVQGDIEAKFSTLTEIIEDLKQYPSTEFHKYSKNIQKIASNVLSLVNREKKREKVPTLTMAEMFYYQAIESGVKGLGYYVELEAIKDGKSTQNVLPILSKINNEKLSHANVAPLYNFLNDMSLTLIKHREESEIEAFYKDDSVNLNKFMSTIDSFKSQDFKKLCRKVLLKLLKEEGDCDKINKAIIHNSQANDLQDYVAELFELWKAVMKQTPISKILDLNEKEDPAEFKNITFEKLWENSNEDVQLKVIDTLYSKEKSLNEKVYKYLISIIPYSDKYLQEMVKN